MSVMYPVLLMNSVVQFQGDLCFLLTFILMVPGLQLGDKVCMP